MQIGSVELKNEFIMAPIKTGYGDKEGSVTERHLQFYKRRAQAIAAIIPEPLYLDKSLRELPTQMGIDDDNKLDGLKKLTDIIHDGGAKVIAHLNHPGRMANPKIPGNVFYSSTDKPCESGGAVPKRIAVEEISGVVNLFKDAAVRAEKADFDIVELQFGHGYLVAQFLSPKVNDRTDEYGGSFENRTRLAKEILHAVKENIIIPVIIRISANEMVEGGINLDEMKEFAKLLENEGADAVHVTSGSACETPAWYFQHMFIPKGKTWEMAKAIKEEIKIPVATVGQVNEFSDIDKIKNEKMADLIAIGRQMVADPDFIGKYLDKTGEAVIPCLACAQGCLGGVKSGKGLQCLVNPSVGKETELLGVADEPKRYAVVGGGLAGMQAALTLKRRGHNVTLYEKNELGGQFNLAPLTPYKRSVGKLVPYLSLELKNKEIDIVFAEAEESQLVDYDGVILATGSKPAVLEIPGLDSFYWAEILLEENLPENKNVLIIGGGLIGVDIATALIARKNKVTIVKRTTDFGEDMEAIAKTLSLKMLKENGTVFSDHTHIKKVEGKTVYAEKDGKEIKFNDIDLIVVSVGMRSYKPLEEKLKDKVPIYVIGDAKKVGNAQNAISDAYETTKGL
jgi:2,4-dienoyl-CoA reductase-like NADH-dependent reductase (Old Yellow Enzyme family)/thioredoxin reductase